MHFDRMRRHGDPQKNQDRPQKSDDAVIPALQIKAPHPSFFRQNTDPTRHLTKIGFFSLRQV
jgi:hypothetical protein